MLLAARWLLTGTTPPIEHGAIVIEDGIIRDIGARQWFAKKDVSEVIDLGETILVPGLVNAHAHLEHSALKSPQPPGGQRGISFTAWVRTLQEKSSQISPSENEKAIKYAIDELIRGGTTTLVDHRSPDCPPIETPFREMLFLELIGPSKSKAEESRRNGLKWLEENDDLERLCHLTPHSLYSVHPDILQEVFSAGTTLSLHLLESDEEEQFFRSRQGPLFELVRSRGGSPLRAESPVAWIEEHRSNDTNILLIHGNYLKEDEIRRLKGQNAFVIHCPGSHRFFGPRAFPHESYIRCGIRIGLGTDSLASNESVNMLRQMKLMKETTNLGEEDILRMATLNGAMAIGVENEIGTLEVGKKADIVGVPLLNQKVDPYEALLLPDQVSFSMVRGRVIFCTHP